MIENARLLWNSERQSKQQTREEDAMDDGSEDGYRLEGKGIFRVHHRKHSKTSFSEHPRHVLPPEMDLGLPALMSGHGHVTF